MGGEDKISVKLAGKPLVQWSVECLARSDRIGEIALVLSEKNLRLGEELIRSEGWKKVKLCLGDLRRQDSVKKGLDMLQACEFVIVHDAARPCITDRIVEQGIVCALEHGSAVAAAQITDTVKRVITENMTVYQTEDRRKLWTVQTPQIFRYDVLKQAYASEQKFQPYTDVPITDESMLVEQMGVEVRLYASSRENIKVTEPVDLLLAGQILLSRRP
jgi:2-C-methyl-D-erythritol 4-phosphate cytidylyltransferase